MSDELLNVINTKLDGVNEKLVIQNGRLNTHSDKVTEMNLVLREVVTVLDTLPCEERIETCHRAIDLVVNGFKEKKAAKRAKSAKVSALAGAGITAGLSLIIWVISMYVGG